MRAKEEVLGWEACIAVVTLFIYIIVQAGLLALQRCFVCHSLQPRGYGGLVLPMINIQRDSHLEPRPALPGFGFMYIYLFFIFDLFIHFMFFPLFSSSSSHMLSLISKCYSYFLIQGLPSITHVHLYNLCDVRGSWLYRTSEVRECYGETTTTHGSIYMLEGTA